MPSTRFAPPAEVPGLAARRIAADILDGVLHKRRMLDDQLDGAAATLSQARPQGVAVRPAARALGQHLACNCERLPFQVPSADAALDRAALLQ